MYASCSAALDSRQAELLLLRGSGLSYAEVAAALELNPSSVGTLLTAHSRRSERSTSSDMENNEMQDPPWVEER